MSKHLRCPSICAVLLLLLAPLLSRAQDKPVPDTLVFANGDQLTGHLVSAAGGSIVFASDMAGSITVPFEKVKELRAGSKASEFALLRKGEVIKHGSKVPEGTVSIVDNKVSVTPSGPATNADATSVPATIAPADISMLVARPEFDKEVNGHEGFSQGWHGAANAGASLVRSTSNATTLTAGLGMVRATPSVAWLPPRDRTSFNLLESYGQTSSPSVTTIKTDIFHADAERDQYFSRRLYALGDVAFDHSYAQGLSLQQIYGGGIGYTVIKDAKQELDVKADIHYEMQSFSAGIINGVVVGQQASTHLVGATIFEGYNRALPHKVAFTESVAIIPSFNVPSAYSMNFNAGLAVPVIKKISASFNFNDAYLNNPPPGLNKNSLQFVAGFTYTLR